MVYATDSRIVPLRMGCILVCTRYLIAQHHAQIYVIWLYCMSSVGCWALSAGIGFTAVNVCADYQSGLHSGHLSIARLQGDIGRSA